MMKCTINKDRVRYMTDTLKVELKLPPLVKSKLIETSEISGMGMNELISSIVVNSVGRALSTKDAVVESDPQPPLDYRYARWKRPAVIDHHLEKTWCVDFMVNHPDTWAAILHLDSPLPITDFLTDSDAAYLSNAGTGEGTVEFGITGILSANPAFGEKIADSLWHFPLVGPNRRFDFTVDSKHPVYFTFEDVSYTVSLDVAQKTVTLSSNREACAQPLLGVVFTIKLKSTPRQEDAESDIVKIPIPFGEPLS